MWNYDEFRKGSFVEVLHSPATMRWGVTVRSPMGEFVNLVYPPARGIVVDVFMDDLNQKYSMVLFHSGIAGHVYLNSLKLIG